MLRWNIIDKYENSNSSYLDIVMVKRLVLVQPSGI